MWKTSTKTEEPIETDSEEPLMVLKPVFVLWGDLGVVIFTTVLFGGLITGFFRTIIGAIIRASSQGFGVDPIPYMVLGVLSFFGIPILYKYNQKKSYSKTEYRIYSDRIEYYEGFFTIKRKTVLFSNIAQITMSERLYQQKWNLGTIFLFTPTLAGMKGYSSGVKVKDIESPDKVYKKLREIVSLKDEKE